MKGTLSHVIFLSVEYRSLSSGKHDEKDLLNMPRKMCRNSNEDKQVMFLRHTQRMPKHHVLGVKPNPATHDDPPPVTARFLARTHTHTHTLPTFGRVLESAVDDGSEQLGLEQKVSEPGAVDRHVRSLHVLLGVGGVTSSAVRRRLLHLLVIVQQLLLSGVLNFSVGHRARFIAAAVAGTVTHLFA